MAFFRHALRAESTWHRSLCVGIGLVAFFVSGCFRCEDTVLKEVTSPDGQWIASAYERNCGATTGIALNVSIRPAKERFKSQKGLVFVGDNFDRVGVQWQSASNLTVSYPNYARKFTTQTNFGLI